MRSSCLRRLAIVAVFAVFAPVLAACSGGDDANDAANSGPTAGTTAEPTQDAAVAVGETDLGQIVVDADGRTLYVFFADENGKSTCYDECEATWPPLTVDSEPSGDGVNATLGTTEREDGTTQVTLNDQPLYYFASDEAAGDTNGQGIGEVWYVVSPDGEAITQA